MLIRSCYSYDKNDYFFAAFFRIHTFILGLLCFSVLDLFFLVGLSLQFYVLSFPFCCLHFFLGGSSSQLSVAYFLSLSLSPFHFLLNPRQQSQVFSNVFLVHVDWHSLVPVIMYRESGPLLKSGRT